MFSSDKGHVRRAGGARGDLRGRRACGEGTPGRRSWWLSAASAAFIGLACFRLFIDLAGGDLASPSPASASTPAAAEAGGRGRRRRKDRGLPADDELRNLARTYLVNQRRLWPELAAGGMIPEPADDVLGEYAEAFRRAFLGEPVSDGPCVATPVGLAAAAVYLRFSSENSNPRSLDQQLRLTLERARREGQFVPWGRVYADSGVSGTTAGRIGYRLAKAAMLDRAGPGTLHVDDLSRLSRDMVESIRLCRDLNDRGKRVVGASDGFDTELEMYKAVLGVSGLVHEFYVDGLKKKVHRGMDDGFRTGKNLHPPGFGYRLVPVTDPSGRPAAGRRNKQVLRVEVFEEEAAVVRELFRRYVAEGHSTNRLAAWLNETAAGGRRNWGPSHVAGMLDRHVYVGVEVRGTTRQRRDRETGKVTHDRRPKSEWKARRARHLRIVDRATWKAARKRRAERSALFPEGSRGRAAVYPTRLLSLACGGCGATLVLGKSGEYAQVRCPNGVEGRHGCRFGGYKSLRKVERPVLALVSERLSDPAYVDRVVGEANAALEDFAKVPKPDVAPLEARVRALREEEKRLVEAIATSDAAVTVLTPRLEENQRRLKDARARLNEAKAATADPPGPVTADEVRAMLSNLRDLIGEDVSVAAPVLHELLGEVVLTQQSEPGAKKPVWYAEFGIDGFGAACRAGRDGTTEDRKRRLLRFASPAGPEGRIRIRLDPFPKPAKPKAVHPYQRLAEEAARLRDEGLAFSEIGRRLGVHEVTAMRAYDHARPQERPKRGRKRPQGGKAAQVRPGSPSCSRPGGRRRRRPARPAAAR